MKRGKAIKTLAWDTANRRIRKPHPECKPGCFSCSAKTTGYQMGWNAGYEYAIKAARRQGKKRRRK